MPARKVRVREPLLFQSPIAPLRKLQPLAPKSLPPSLRSGWDKGYEAGKNGLPREENPYPDKRADYHRSVTFSRAWRNVWHEGWDAGKREREKKEKK